MVNYQDDVLTPSDIDELVKYLRLDDHRTDDRPDFRTKHPRWDIDEWPQHIMQRALDRVIGPGYAVQEIDLFESQTPLKLHADAHAAPNELYYAVLFPFYSNPVGYTMFFDNYWRGSGRAAHFSRSPHNQWKQRIVNKHGNWTVIHDLREFLRRCQEEPTSITEFDVTPEFVKNIETVVFKRSQPWAPPHERDSSCLAPTEPRFNDYAAQIINYDHMKIFPKDIWEKHLQHQDYEDFHGLTIDKIVENRPGRAIWWDRSQLHCATSNHKIKNGITVMTVRKPQ